MGKSPSLDIIKNNLSGIKKKLENNKKNITFLFIILYLFLTLYLLLRYKPKLICHDTSDILQDRKNISYTKFILYYLLIQIPIFLYLII
jgi:hypothetical protein